MDFGKNTIQDEKLAVIFIGIQASGKTSFYEKKFKKLVHINLDELHTRNKENQLLHECVEKGTSFVADNTNPTRADREKYILAAKEYGYKIKGYYFRSSIRESVERNSFREGKAKVPNRAIASTHNRLELPEYAEGFDELYYVYIVNNDFSVQDWDEDKV